jgi:hypothetical protein
VCFESRSLGRSVPCRPLAAYGAVLTDHDSEWNTGLRHQCKRESAPRIVVALSHEDGVSSCLCIDDPLGSPRVRGRPASPGVSASPMGCPRSLIANTGTRTAISSAPSATEPAV